MMDGKYKNKNVCQKLWFHTLFQQYTGIAQYMANAAQHAEFSQTCAQNDEIIWSYGGPKPKLKN